MTMSQGNQPAGDSVPEINKAEGGCFKRGRFLQKKFVIVYSSRGAYRHNFQGDRINLPTTANRSIPIPRKVSVIYSTVCLCHQFFICYYDI